MKQTVSLAVALLVATVLCAKPITNNVRQRLDPILASVSVTDAERGSLIETIETFQSRMRAAYKENAPDKKKKTAAITADYEKQLQKILGKERYSKWKKDERAAREAAEALKARTAHVSPGVLKRLNPILAAVKVTDEEKEKLIEAIRTFQNATNSARKTGDKEKAKQVNSTYQAELERILGTERYATFKKAEKEARKKNPT